MPSPSQHDCGETLPLVGEHPSVNVCPPPFVPYSWQMASLPPAPPYTDIADR